MNTSTKNLLVTTVAAFAALVASTWALAGAVHAVRVPGESLDNGLGDLPHYTQWVDKSGADPMGSRVLGESLDNGLGALPPYAQWWDKTGRDPMGISSAALAPAARR